MSQLYAKKIKKKKLVFYVVNKLEVMKTKQNNPFYLFMYLFI